MTLGKELLWTEDFYPSFGVFSTPVLELKNKGLKLPKKGVILNLNFVLHFGVIITPFEELY